MRQGVITSALNHALHSAAEGLMGGGGDQGDPPKMGDCIKDKCGIIIAVFDGNKWIPSGLPVITGTGQIAPTDSPIEWLIGAGISKKILTRMFAFKSAGKGVNLMLKSIDDVFTNPQILQGKPLEKVMNAFGNSKGWINDVMRKSSRAEGWVLREMNKAGTDFTGRILQYHPGTPRHFGGTPYWKVSSGNGTFRIPINH